MNFSNQTKLAALAYDMVDPAGDTFHVLVARAAFDLRAASSGHATLVASRTAEPAELVFSDVTFGEMNRSSVKLESDLAQTKPKCDVIVIGAAHSPNGEPVKRIEVGVRIHRAVALPDRDADAGTLLDHRLVVHGPRSFVRRGEAAGVTSAPTAGGWRLTDPEPFVSLPIRYEHAFGGQLKVHEADEAAKRLADSAKLNPEAKAKHPDGDAAPIAHTTCLFNPFGIGWLEGWYADALEIDRWPAPRIEAPNAEITATIFERVVDGKARAGSQPELVPRGLGVIAKPWQPRLALAGNFDGVWLEERWPDMPTDFDMAYWNGAHPEMQCAYLYGGEEIETWNLLPANSPGAKADDGRSVCRFVVPDVGLAIRLTALSGESAWVPPRIDTVILDLDEMTLSLVYRLVFYAGNIASAVMASLAELEEAEAQRTQNLSAG